MATTRFCAGSRINSGEGNDRIDSGEGDDTIRSGEGNDTIYSGEGDDWTDGGAGFDQARFDVASSDFTALDIFGDAKMTTALLDRLTHRCHILETGDDSYCAFRGIGPGSQIDRHACVRVPVAGRVRACAAHECIRALAGKDPVVALAAGERIRPIAADQHQVIGGDRPGTGIQIIRTQLNRGGDRAANSALHIIAIGRLRCDERTQDYVPRRISDGLSKLEAIRCLKRYIAREVFNLIKNRNQEINQSQIAA